LAYVEIVLALANRPAAVENQESHRVVNVEVVTISWIRHRFIKNPVDIGDLSSCQMRPSARDCRQPFMRATVTEYSRGWVRPVVSRVSQPEDRYRRSRRFLPRRWHLLARAQV